MYPNQTGSATLGIMSKRFVRLLRCADVLPGIAVFISCGYDSSTAAELGGIVECGLGARSRQAVSALTLMMTAGGETVKQWLLDTLDHTQTQLDTTHTHDT